jgi:hypothetical protein
MGKASGVLLVAAGLGAAVYAALPASKSPTVGNDDFDFQLNQPAFTRSEAAHPNPSQANPSQANPSQAAPAATPARSQSAGRLSSETTQAVASAPAVVTVSPNPRLAVNSAPKAGVLATDRTQLARELQKELRRVGCYDGEINGGWTTSTKRAMKTFTERVNASLPVEEPDLVLLSLVQAQADKTCSRPCPAGEALADGGRCVPNAVAASPRKAAHGTGPNRDASPQPAIGWSTTTAGASAAPPMEGRMGLAGPDEEAPNAELGATPLPGPAPLPRPAAAGAGYTAPMSEARSAATPERSPSRRFDAQSFFRRMDKQSAN